MQKVKKPKLKYIQVKNLDKEKQAQVDKAFDILFEETLKEIEKPKI